MPHLKCSMISKIGLALSNVVAAILILTMYLERKFIEIKQCMSAVHDKYYQKNPACFERQLLTVAVAIA